MTQIYITFDPADEPLLAGLITLPKRRFARLPVVPAQVDEGTLALLSGLEEFYIHTSDFTSYLPILKALDAVAVKPAPTVTNISLSPGPLPYDESEPINVASRIVATAGQTLVFAAGNDGPAEGTLSPWCVAPWVIGVGAATPDGTALLPESSVGRPNALFQRPTVVAPGETVVPLHPGRADGHGTMVGLVLVGKDQPGRNLPGYVDKAFRGTSVAAPKVTRITNFIVLLLRIILSIDKYLRQKMAEDGSRASAAAAITRTWATVLERGVLDHPAYAVLHDLPATCLTQIVRFFAHLSVHGAFPAQLQWPETGSTPFPTSVIKQMLESMARPMPGYGVHQVGAGFVSEELASAYLTGMTGVDLLKVLFPSGWEALGAGWRDGDAPLVPGELLEAIKGRFSTMELQNYQVL